MKESGYQRGGLGRFPKEIVLSHDCRVNRNGLHRGDCREGGARGWDTVVNRVPGERTPWAKNKPQRGDTERRGHVRGGWSQATRWCEVRSKRAGCGQAKQALHCCLHWY